MKKGIKALNDSVGNLFLVFGCLCVCFIQVKFDYVLMSSEILLHWYVQKLAITLNLKIHFTNICHLYCVKFSFGESYWWSAHRGPQSSKYGTTLSCVPTNILLWAWSTENRNVFKDERMKERKCFFCKLIIHVIVIMVTAVTFHLSFHSNLPRWWHAFYGKEIEEASLFPGIPVEQARLATFHEGDGVKNLLGKPSQ